MWRTNVAQSFNQTERDGGDRDNSEQQFKKNTRNH